MKELDNNLNTSSSNRSLLLYLNVIVSSIIRRDLRDLERSPRDKRRVSSLVLEIYSRVNSIKRSKGQLIKN